MDKLKELFGKYAEKIWANGNCDECGCGTAIESQSKYLSESQFQSAVEERDKQGVCGNCKWFGHCDIQDKAMEVGWTKDFGCNQLEPKEEL